eukprot:CAMPEP_0204610282 /NCGR_PEP_ID=MMETSP0661-20131031/61423_1 /ASSEMBLY_ACC=CAM_ASM_000606 /TAXON_ID=109239 /ORGANISM="Alexandrium margalefi, Strain AMGDE01CS-322" /LENGTH=193 /DNA_ID=CAMNT_0051622087 /DNA_START=212 /DNA_END=790 /DNA_ORIENTATION=-
MTGLTCPPISLKAGLVALTGTTCRTPSGVCDCALHHDGSNLSPHFSQRPASSHSLERHAGRQVACAVPHKSACIQPLGTLEHEGEALLTPVLPAPGLQDAVHGRPESLYLGPAHFEGSGAPAVPHGAPVLGLIEAPRLGRGREVDDGVAKVLAALGLDGQVEELDPPRKLPLVHQLLLRVSRGDVADEDRGLA